MRLHQYRTYRARDVVGRAEIFDCTDNPEIQEDAVNICLGCAALAACVERFTSMRPSARPHGVVAGQVSPPRTPKSRPGRPRKEVAA